MQKKFILYAPQIRSGGGMTLLKALLTSIPDSFDCVAVLDERFAHSDSAAPGWDLNRISGSGVGRLRAELWLFKNVKKNDLVSPGHVFPIVSKDGGVLVRAGHTEGSVDISRLAKCGSSAVICEIMNDDGTMAKGEQLIKFAKKHKLKLGRIDDLIAYRLKSEKLIKFKKISTIKIKDEVYKIKIFENLLDGSENFALVKGNLRRSKNPRVRVISSNIVQNYLMGQKLPNSFNQTIDHFKYHKECVLIFIRDTNLKSVSQTLRDYKNNKFYKKGQDKLIKNYGIGAQIIKALNIKNMILVTRSRKKVVGLEGYGIKITKQEIIK